MAPKSIHQEAEESKERDAELMIAESAIEIGSNLQ